MNSQPTGRLGPEFSRPFSLDALGESEVVERIEASAAERQALAERLSLQSLERLVAELRVARTDRADTIAVTGRVEAQVSQTCVVTLRPLARRLNETFSALYAQCQSAEAEGGPVEVDAAAEDPPEVLGPEGLDLGEAAVQHLAVALDPYPRGEDATLDALDWVERDGGDAPPDSPFAGLRSLRRGP